MKKLSTYTWLMILALLFNSVPRWIHGISLWEDRSLYYVGQALSFTLILFAQKYPITNRIEKVVYNNVLWLSIGNLLDELFFDPVTFGLNEKVFVSILIAYNLYQPNWKKWIMYLKKAK